MNLQLTQVLSDITGKTGLAIIRASLAGDPVISARHKMVAGAARNRKICYDLNSSSFAGSLPGGAYVRRDQSG